MLHIHRILCPVDLSEPSRRALDYAVVLARWYAASVTVLHVYTPAFMPLPGPLMAGVDPRPTLQPLELEALTARVNEFVAATVPDEIQHDVLIDSGNVPTRVVAQATGVAADIVVIGTHGASGLEHLMVGSVTEKVLRKSAVPVLTVPPAAQPTAQLPFKRLVCPVDFSYASLDAVASAFEIARDSAARIVLLHVLEGPHDEEPITSRSFNVPEYRRMREEEAGIRLARLIPADARHWCQPAAMLAHGKPHREILRIAEAESADLIVIGVHGRNAVDVALFGSTTNQIVRESACPVLTVRAMAERQAAVERYERADVIQLPG